MDPLQRLATFVSTMNGLQIALCVVAGMALIAGGNLAAYLNVRRRGRRWHQSSLLDIASYDRREWGLLALSLLAFLALLAAAISLAPG